MFNKEQQKENAVVILEKVGCYGPYLKAFKKGTITMYEGFGGYYIDESSEPELMAKIKEIEAKYNATVYTVIHNIMYGSEDCYSLLFTEASRKNSPQKWGEGFLVNAYVWNKSCDWCSERGDIVIKPALGGLIRIS